jgi:TonB family protein
VNSSSETVLHTRVGLWLGGSLLLHALALPLFDLTDDNAGSAPASLHVTLLGALPTSAGSVSAAAEPVNARPTAHVEPAEVAKTSTATVSAAAESINPPSTARVEPTAIARTSTATVSAATEPVNPPSTARVEPTAVARTSTATVSAVAEPVNPPSTARVEPAAVARTSTSDGDHHHDRHNDAVDLPATDNIGLIKTLVKPTATKSVASSIELASNTPATLAITSAPTTGKANDRATKAASRTTPAPVHRAATKTLHGTDQTTSSIKLATAGSAAKSPESGATRVPQAASNSNRTAAPDARIDAANHDVFVQLLHAAIDKNKRYPRLARRQRRQGVATVLFRLHPHGAVDRLEVHDSSGFAALDAAALRAVAAVAPFAPASKFLTREAHFRIGVEFHLY